MAKRQENPTIPPAKEWPSYWFVRFDKANQDGDEIAADEARRELRRLGYEVSYTGRQPQGVGR